MKINSLFQRLFTLVLGSSLLLSACATTSPQRPITDPSKRLEFKKFSLLPPQGDNWFIVLSKPGNGFILLAKQIDSTTPLGAKSFQPHTVRAGVKAVDTKSESVGSQQEYFDSIKQSEQANTSSRFTVLKESYSLHEKVGEYCVIVDKLSEDRGVPNDPGTVYMFQENKLFCFDPQSRIAVMAGCSQRAPDIKVIIDLKDECEPFMNSLRFSTQ
jgi:hypothetical protein